MPLRDGYLFEYSGRSTVKTWAQEKTQGLAKDIRIRQTVRETFDASCAVLRRVR